ncbi:MAG TPA: hypothetical protein VKO43_08625 [Candidatus Krumholzibacteriaceae bacterium]|nr:hypothetical protein [Candidatus Krumholzibacteriaceae bacterium]
MKKTGSFFVLLVGFIVFLTPDVFSQVDLGIETGAVFSGYNDVRIPGDGGTKFSLSEELETDAEGFYRIRVFYNFNERHHLGVLYAPLSINSNGKLDRDLVFEGETFGADTPLEAKYRFNSYRLTYRYDFMRNDKIEMGIGFTGKIRDAEIAVKGDGLESEKSNVGFVPIIHYRLLWKFAEKFAFLLDGDALVAPQGRAEDILAALTFRATDKIDMYAGYRILEGGADNDEVYNFTLINYASVGAVFHFE